MIKLIFSDMDGSLLDNEGNLPKEFDAMMAKLKERNVMFAPASGRQYYSLIKTFEKYKEDMIFLAENGAITRHGNGEVYFADAINKDTVSKIFRKCQNMGFEYIVLCGAKSSYVTRGWERHLDECNSYYKRYEFIDDFDRVDDDIVKVAVADCDTYHAEKTLYPFISEEFGKDMQVLLSGAVWVDVMNKEAGKGKAAKELMARLGVKFDEAAAFGDYLNDLTMMEAVHYSYAMENAHEDLKAVARFTAPSNTESGVVKQIYKLIEEGLI